MIHVEHLAKAFGDFKAVRDVSFSAECGEIVGFLGPNGAGKTTTLRMLTTYLPSDSGIARVAGFDINYEANEVRRRIGYLPETPPLYGEMTVSEYLNFVATLKGVPSTERRDAVKAVLAKCFLEDVKDKLCQFLSKGYRQRVGLAQAIVHEPQVIILDEPTSGLDPRQIIEIRKLIGSLAERRTVLLSTHILQEVEMVCTKVVMVNRGRTIMTGTIDDVKRGRSLEEIFIDSLREDEETLVKVADVDEEVSAA
jgi:ABC-2 type transport system ATP-binding protein